MFSVQPMYCALVLLVSTVALYTMAFFMHSPFRGQFDLTRQLHFGWAACLSLFRIFLLWLLIMDDMLFVQLYPIFIVFLLMILLRRWLVGKCLSKSCRNVLPMLLVTAALYGGLNQVMWRDLCLFLGTVVVNFKCVLYPLSLSADSYSGLALSNCVSSADMSDRRFVIIWGIF